MPKPPAKPSAKQDRLARALRANLKRRKSQSRAKASRDGDAAAAEEAEPSAAPLADEPAGSAPQPRPNMAQKGA